MNIALVCPYSFDVPGGVGTHVRGLARWLRDQGHRVLVLAPGTRAAAPGERLVGASMPFRFNGSTAHLAVRPSQARQATAFLREADIVHVHEPLTPGLAFAAARSARRLVVTHHACFRPGLFAPMLRLRAASLRPRQSLAVSDQAAATAHLVTGVIPTVVPNAIDMPPAVAKRTSGMPVVVHLGRRDDVRKGYHVFEHVAERMAGEARFVAIGPGRRRSRYVAEYDTVSNEIRDAWLQEAAVLMAPNTFGESFGMVIIEALARGCGIVASDLPAFRSVVDDPRCTTWFPPGDTNAAVTALRAHLDEGTDPLVAMRWAERYSWPEVGPKIMACYEAALRD